MPDYTRKHLPDAIYLDTNILRSAGFGLSKHWMSELRSFASDYGIPLCITKLVLEEWCELVLENLKGHHRKFLGALDVFKEYQIDIPITEDSTVDLPDRNVLREVERERLTNAGFIIIDNWSGTLDQIIIEAVSKTPPFEDRGKGFCDMIIVESCILHATELSANPRIVVMTNDGAIRRCQERFSSRGITVTILREDEVVENLKALLDSEVASFRGEREAQLFEYVKKHEPEILSFVSKSPLKFTDLWLSNSLGQGGWMQGSIRSVLAAKPTKITKVVGGAPVFREKVPADRYPVEIWVEMELDVILEESNFHEGMFQPRAIVEPERIDESSPLTLEARWTLGSPKEKRRTIKREVYVEATVNKAGVASGEYIDLKLEGVH